MVAAEELTRRQAQLINELRAVDSDILRLTHRRRDIREELERIYPQARVLQPAPKEQGVVLSIWNYVAEGYDCSITITPKGKRAVGNFDAALQETDLYILALVSGRTEPVNATKLLALPLFSEDHAATKRRIAYLDKWSYIDLHYTKEGVQA